MCSSRSTWSEEGRTEIKKKQGDGTREGQGGTTGYAMSISTNGMARTCGSKTAKTLYVCSIVIDV